MDLSRLREPFQTSQVSWRAQTVVERDGKTFALALAYVDARDVMERLDEACGMENWQCRYPHAGAKTCCEIGIKIGNEWVWKADGAGDTDVEADKGAFSDAFKRAAVKWGIAQYLYALDAPWVPCEAYKRQSDGKWAFKKFLDDPWMHIRKVKPDEKGAWGGPLTKTEFKKAIMTFNTDLQVCEDVATLDGLLMKSKPLLDQCKKDMPLWWHTQEGGASLGFNERIEQRRAELLAREPDPRG